MRINWMPSDHLQYAYVLEGERVTVDGELFSVNCLKSTRFTPVSFQSLHFVKGVSWVRLMSSEGTIKQKSVPNTLLDSLTQWLIINTNTYMYNYEHKYMSTISVWLHVWLLPGQTKGFKAVQSRLINALSFHPLIAACVYCSIVTTQHAILTLKINSYF